MFKNFFGKKAVILQTESESDEIKLLHKQYDKSKQDSKILDKECHDFILKSLELDFDAYKSFVDQFHIDGLAPISPRNQFYALLHHTYTPQPFWHICDLTSDEFNLYKMSEKCFITVSFRYLEDNKDFKLHGANFYVETGHITALNSPEIEKIIYKYFFYAKLKRVTNDRDSKKSNFQKAIDTIGKDVKRNATLEELLK